MQASGKEGRDAGPPTIQSMLVPRFGIKNVLLLQSVDLGSVQIKGTHTAGLGVGRHSARIWVPITVHSSGRVVENLCKASTMCPEALCGDFACVQGDLRQFSRTCDFEGQQLPFFRGQQFLTAGPLS